jgi:hypothetical protein
VNGEKQIPAKLKDQPWKDGIGGEILDFKTNAQRDYVLMDPTHAYPGKELKKWKRTIVLQKPVTTVIVDEVGSNPGASIAARFFPPSAPAVPRMGREREGRNQAPNTNEYMVSTDHVLISSHRNNLALIPLVLDNNFRIIEGRLADVPVTEDATLNWIPYVETVATAKANTSILVTLLVPVNDQKEAESVAKKAKIVSVNANKFEVSVEGSFGSFRWVFERDKSGFVPKD